MTQENYNKLISEIPSVDLVRPFWNHEEYHNSLWAKRNITVLICQRQTKHSTRLCLDSLLNFYTDIPVLVVDGDSQDDSLLYLKIKSSLYPNVKLWERTGRNSHGETMDDAINKFIKTKYVMLMDSDTIVMRGGWIEEMLHQFEVNDNLYATGTRMLVTRKGEACGAPEDESDVLMYAHPSLSIYDVEKYKLLTKFVDHGAACCHNNVDSELHGYEIGYYPIDKYVAHLSGASWCVPRTIWSFDNNVFSRPLVTFIPLSYIDDFESLSKQDYKNFDVVLTGNVLEENLVIHGEEPFTLRNAWYEVRFNVFGEYVCVLNGEFIEKNFVRMVAEEIIKEPRDNFFVGNIQLIKRKIWQQTIALQ